jgi:hypothetical protein
LCSCDFHDGTFAFKGLRGTKNLPDGEVKNARGDVGPRVTVLLLQDDVVVGRYSRPKVCHRQ